VPLDRGRHDRTWQRFRLGCHQVTSALRVAVARSPGQP
jgi:hypothetical protein